MNFSSLENTDPEKSTVTIIPVRRVPGVKPCDVFPRISGFACLHFVCFFAQGKVAQTACMSACQHLSTSLMQMLLDSELKQISMGAVQQFNLDVIQCERKYMLSGAPAFSTNLQLAALGSWL